MSHVLKQIIVMRRDLKMTRGKEIAQGAHASMAVITQFLALHNNENNTYPHFRENRIPEELYLWLQGSFTKICVTVNSEQELLDVYNKAKENGILCSLITDNGATMFNGVPTITCCAIGPTFNQSLTGITDNLKLY